MDENRKLFRIAYPGGKEKAFTTSYDDGVLQDRRLISLMHIYGIKGTFNLNSARLSHVGMANIFGHEVDVSTCALKDIHETYKGFEIATHGRTHSSLVNIGALAGAELIEDRIALEAELPYLVRGHAYPYGFFDENVKTALRTAGIKYARTIHSTHSFDLPADYLEWNPTCHHGDPLLMELARNFCEEPVLFRGPMLFYLWGHAYEFDQYDNWSVIEELFAYISGYNDQIWFASNIEIQEYIEAAKALEFTADCRKAYNPTAKEVWFDAGVWGQKNILKIAPGETVCL